MNDSKKLVTQSFGLSFCITSSRLKLAGFARMGYSLKLASHWATAACAGTFTKALWTIQSS
ncbi:hypothetical protein BDD14_1318 [Edaphobacter modestus]|uniref:Uncharacterized protein n=1 Tax=Edaphobacter modestus TaxID=388466 RepID=A0A4V2G482_9BACT|nr:hypothetical protein BDD14_1318 [Edaphobacter modestus]